MRMKVKFREINHTFKPHFQNLQIIDKTRNPVIQPLKVTENGKYPVPEGVDGFSPVKVDVPLRYDEGFADGYNQGYDKGYPEGYEASQKTIVLQEKTTTENGEFTPDEGFTGFSKFTVDVPERKEEEEKTLSVTKNGNYEVIPEEGKSMSKVNVDVNVVFDGEIGKPYIDTSKITSFRYFYTNNCRLDILPLDSIDTSNGTDFSFMFNYCEKLETILPFDTSNGTDFSGMFNECRALKTIPQLDTSKGTSFRNMFNTCKALETIPQLDTSNGTDFFAMFYYCEKLKTIPQFDTSKGKNIGEMFNGCKALETVTLTTASKNLSSNTFSGCVALKNLTIGEGWAVSIYLHYSNNLTVESLHGMIENLADLTGQTAKTFKIGSTNLAKIDEEHLAMLQNKNWNYS